MRGAPQISSAAGSFIAALDAFLITGFGAVTALSVSVQDGIATATLQAGDSFAEYCVVLIAGATPAELNGEARVLTATNTSITWATTAPNGPATGVITIKVAPVGWDKPFSGTDQAVYRSTDNAGSRFCLYVDDTGGQWARVRGFETMSGLNVGTGPFPTDVMASGGGYLLKSLIANGVAVRYDLVADSRTVLWAIAAGVASNANYITSPVRGFGDLLPLAPGGDAYAVALSCQATTDTASFFGYGQWGQSTHHASFAALYVARGPAGLGSALALQAKSYVAATSTSLSGSDSALGDFPSSIDGELKFAQCYIDMGVNSTPRAHQPAVLHIPQNKVSAYLDARDKVDGTGTMAGRKLLSLLVSANTYSVLRTAAGVALIDITGPWR